MMADVRPPKPLEGLVPEDVKPEALFVVPGDDPLVDPGEEPLDDEGEAPDPLEPLDDDGRPPALPLAAIEDVAGVFEALWKAATIPATPDCATAA